MTMIYNKKALLRENERCVPTAEYPVHGMSGPGVGGGTPVKTLPLSIIRMRSVINHSSVRKVHKGFNLTEIYVMQQRQEEHLLLQKQMIQRLPRGGGRLH